MITNINIIKKVDEVINVLTDGRTFFDGYFDVPLEYMNRTDRATYMLLQLKKELKNGKNNTIC